MKGALILAVSLLMCCYSSTSSACRYSVRDVGFVDLGSSPYRLYGYINNETPESQAEAFKQIAYAVLLDSNVEVEILNVDQDKNHPALEYYHWLQLGSFPSAALVSPEGDAIEIPLTKPGKSFKESLWTALESVVVSPVRDTVIKDLIESYCVILYVQCKNAAQNLRIREGLQEIITRVENSMSLLPKLIENPPRLVEIEPSAFEQETVFIRSLGVKRLDGAEPYAMVLYGRGRKIGSLLRGEEILSNALFNTIYLVGQSCECGLDREQMMGVMFPLRWDGATQKLAAKKLGFDAESPMVKMEIGQILSINSSGVGTGGSVEDALLGYTEMTIDVEPDTGQLIVQDTRSLGSYTELPVEGAMEDNSSTAGLQSAAPGAMDMNLNQDKAALSSSQSSNVQNLETQIRIRYTTSLIIICGIVVLMLTAGIVILLRARTRIQ